MRTAVSGGPIPAEFRARGLTPDELTRAQEEAEAVFPEDLVELLTACLPVGPEFPDWRHEPAAAMAQWRARLTEGVLFDVQTNGVWLEDWGERPMDDREASELVAELIRQAPALIPIYGHRGIPNEPFERGNPVFSVVQTDVVVYGVDLEDYLRHEFGGRRLRPVPETERKIRFWTSLALAG